MTHFQIHLAIICIINLFFAVCGVFLNSMVILTFVSSINLRNKTCYFMILLLSCNDLLLSSFVHSDLVHRAIWRLYEDGKGPLNENIVRYIRLILYSNSFITLLMMNVERYLALIFPFFYERSVTKRKLFMVMLVLQMTIISVVVLCFWKKKDGTFLSIFLLSILLIVMFFVYFKLHKIARNLQESVVVPSSSESSIDIMKNKTTLMKVKKTSTCVLAVACVFICSFPSLIIICLKATSYLKNLNKEMRTVIHYYDTCLLTINATLNCLIFFWKNNALRSEGIKVLYSFQNVFKRNRKC